MQLREKDILGCLPPLASVLGNTYGVHVRIGGADACTDGNMITFIARRLWGRAAASGQGLYRP